MKMHPSKLIFLSSIGVACGILLLCSGCKSILGGGSKPIAWNLQITAKTKYSVVLDLVGINQLNKQDWEQVTVDNYWTNSSLRKYAKRITFRIVDGKITLADQTQKEDIKGDKEAPVIEGLGTPQIIIPRDHPIWDAWLKQNAIGLVAIGNITVQQVEDPDKRKWILPLNKKFWDTKGKVLELEVQDDRIDVITPPSKKASKYGL